MTALRLGILGTAGVAGKFVQGVAGSRKVTVGAVASRSLERAQQFARQHAIAAAFGSYEALLAAPDIDAVYLPLPNTLHAQWAVRALDSGKHVLCEKPLAMLPEEARMMFAAAERADRHLVEGYPYRYQPITARLRELLAHGEIGALRLIQASIGFLLSNAPNIRLDAALGGGALLDAGCYPVSLVRMVAGACPVQVQASCHWRAPGVDGTTVVQYEFADGLLAQVCCSFDTAPHRHAMLIGSAGCIEASYWNHPMATPPTLRIQRVKPGSAATASPALQLIEAAAQNGFLLEAEAFSDLVRGERSPWSGTCAQESMDIVRMLAAARRSCVSGRAEPV